MRALANITPLGSTADTTLPGLLDQLGAKFGANTALVSQDDRVSYSELARRSNQYSRWALDQGIRPGDVVCLLMLNCPDYAAIWLGITHVGGVVALINTNLTGDALSHSLVVASPKHIIAGAELLAAAESIRPHLAPDIQCWQHPSGAASWAVLDRERYPGEPLHAGERRAVSIRDTALLIYTSGTTGLPKAARVSHYRILEWSFWFAGMMDAGPGDRLYNCLPMYHSTGGVVGIGSMLVNGGTVVIRQRFSLRRFWDDIVAEACTLFLYIGELCRYLANAPPQARETEHALRLCVGNGLRGDIWEGFQNRFHIPRILEFYASTEGNVALYNCDGRPGAIGRVPSFLAHRFPVALIACDPQTGRPHRGPDGHCIRCQPGEVGEAVGKILVADGDTARPFEGYTDRSASDAKILRDVFAKGDAWFRTGDLMRRDDSGFYYFVDRIGDTFRWKGENVSTTQVAEVISRCAGVAEAVVYGVELPGNDGRAGMAAITIRPGFSLDILHAHLAAHLPEYARPVLLRICASLEMTGTFKPIKNRLTQEGYDPGAGTDEIHVRDPSGQGFARLDAPMLERLRSGAVRL